MSLRYIRWWFFFVLFSKNRVERLKTIKHCNDDERKTVAALMNQHKRPRIKKKKHVGQKWNKKENVRRTIEQQLRNKCLWHVYALNYFKSQCLHIVLVFCLIKTLVQSVRHQTWPSTRIESNRNESNNSLKTSTIFHILFYLMCSQSRCIAVNVILIASSVFEHGVLMQTDLLYSITYPSIHLNEE